MNKMIVTVFDNETAAYEGWRALNDLYDHGDIVVYGMAAITKEPDLTVTIKQAFGPEPWGTVGGLAVGSLIGLLGGPVGVVLGATAGAFSGSLFDLAQVGIDADFMDEVARSLEPGTTAVVAEVDEAWTTPIDTRMTALGGKVFRRTREEVVDAQIERDLDALEADLNQAEAELAQADQAARAKLQARVDEDKAKLQAARDRAKAQIEALRQEADAKVKGMQEQAKTAQAEQKAKLDAQAAEMRADYDRRIAKLEQASELRREAGELTREALKP